MDVKARITNACKFGTSVGWFSSRAVAKVVCGLRVLTNDFVVELRVHGKVVPDASAADGEVFAVTVSAADSAPAAMRVLTTAFVKMLTLLKIFPWKIHPERMRGEWGASKLAPTSTPPVRVGCGIGIVVLADEQE